MPMKAGAKVVLTIEKWRYYVTITAEYSHRDKVVTVIIDDYVGREPRKPKFKPGDEIQVKPNCLSYIGE